MVRTQISLSEEEYKAAKLEAERLGITLAELVRQSLRTMLPADNSKSWMRYSGMVETGNPSSSESMTSCMATDTYHPLFHGASLAIHSH